MKFENCDQFCEWLLEKITNHSFYTYLETHAEEADALFKVTDEIEYWYGAIDGMRIGAQIVGHGDGDGFKAEVERCMQKINVLTEVVERFFERVGAS